MADLRLAVTLDGRVDVHGEARFIRTWTFTNLSKRPLDLTNFEIFVNITSRDVRVLGAGDGQGNTLECNTSQPGPRITAISCFFNIMLEPGARYEVLLTYVQPRALVELRPSRTWVTQDYFERVGPLKDVDFTQEEPQPFEVRMTFQDPRRKLLFLRNPFRAWSVNALEQVTREVSKDSQILIYKFNLGPNETTRDYYTISEIDDRSPLILALGAAASATAAVIIERLLESLF